MKPHPANTKSAGIALVLLLMFLVPIISFSQDKQKTAQPSTEKSEALTPQQAAAIKTILSKYDPKKLTEADAKAIHEKFRQAGIHSNTDTRSAITAAGFDPEKLRALDPPKSPGTGGKPNPPTSAEMLKTVQEKIIKPLALTTAQAETVTSAYRDFYAAMDNLKKTQADPKQPVEKAKVDPLEKARDEKIRKVLAPDKFTKYSELEKSLRPARPADAGAKKDAAGK